MDRGDNRVMIPNTIPEDPALYWSRYEEHTTIQGSEAYSFCESATAIRNIWHIRKLDESGKHPSGGITTPSLCHKVKPFGPENGEFGGWDVSVPITPHHLTHCCKDCATIFRSEVLNDTVP